MDEFVLFVRLHEAAAVEAHPADDAEDVNTAFLAELVARVAERYKAAGAAKAGRTVHHDGPARRRAVCGSGSRVVLRFPAKAAHLLHEVEQLLRRGGGGVVRPTGVPIVGALPFVFVALWEEDASC